MKKKKDVNSLDSSRDDTRRPLAPKKRAKSAPQHTFFDDDEEENDEDNAMMLESNFIGFLDDIEVGALAEPMAFEPERSLQSEKKKKEKKETKMEKMEIEKPSSSADLCRDLITKQRANGSFPLAALVLELVFVKQKQLKIPKEFKLTSQYSNCFSSNS